MYAAVQPQHHTDGSRTEQLAERLRRGEAVRDEDVYNVFESVLGEVDAAAAQRFEQARRMGTPHLCGSGPAMFFLVVSDEHAARLTDGLRGLRLEVAEAHTIAAADALALVELP
jgi:4-diphosphocytidyl-2C-methyl-D-erythritol kinase